MSPHDETGTVNLHQQDAAGAPRTDALTARPAPVADQSWEAVPLAGDDSAVEPPGPSAFWETAKVAGYASDTATRRLPSATPAAGVTLPGPAGGPQELIRFGPGVPGAGTAQAAAVWHGTVRPAPPTGPKPSRRRGPAYAVAVLVVLAVVAFLLWQRTGPALAVRSVAVAAAPGSLSCDATEDVVATVRTNGRAGTLRYHWHRSDGTDGGPQRQTLTAGQASVRLPLRWTFQGHGTYRATASLAVGGPGGRTASVSFTYSCR